MMSTCRQLDKRFGNLGDLTEERAITESTKMLFLKAMFKGLLWPELCRQWA